MVATPSALTAKLIKASDVFIPEIPESERDFSRGKAKAIACDVSERGLKYAITVRAAAEGAKHGKKYELVIGRHRFYACNRILEWSTIPAYVEELDDDAAKMARTAENLFRHELSEPQKALALHQWKQFFMARGKAEATSADPTAPDEPTSDSEATAQSESDAAKSDSTTAPQPDTPKPSRKKAKATSEDEAQGDGHDDINAKLAHMLGISRATAGRLSKVGKCLAGLTEDQRKVIFGAKPAPTRKALDAFSNLMEPAQRGVLALVANGSEFDDTTHKAVAQAKREAAAKAKAEGKTATEDDLSDADWIDTYLAKKLAQITSERTRIRFKNDALFWRAIKKAKEVFIRAIAGTMDAFDLSMPGGATYFNRMKFAIKTKHPQDWALCTSCGSTGWDNSKEKQCQTCYGQGYKAPWDISSVGSK